MVSYKKKEFLKKSNFYKLLNKIILTIKQTKWPISYTI